jgi:hypothetical protein
MAALSHFKEAAMATARQELVALETRFWQSMVDQDTDTALQMLHEPALMISSHGVVKFDHDGYRKMAEHGGLVLTSFEFADMDVVFPNDDTAVITYRVKQGVAHRGDGKAETQEMADSSTWVRERGQWRCVMHSETPVHSPTKH